MKQRKQRIVPSSPHPTPREWLDKAIRRLNEPGGVVYPNDLVLITDLAHALSVTLTLQRELVERLACIESILCDRDMCGHFLAEEIRTEVVAALAAAGTTVDAVARDFINRHLEAARK